MSTTLKINTEFVYPPIPNRSFDWRATDDNFDADYDYAAERYVTTSIVGTGPTEREAVIDYWGQRLERSE